MLLKFKKPHGGFLPGQVVRALTESSTRTLVENGIVEVVGREPAPEPVKAKRGRPRKTKKP